ncbi:MAG: response regulator [Elusimicrobiota bacterium]
MADILVVDDDPTIQDLIREVLAGLGYVFDVASDGNEALRKIRAKRYDVAIIDRGLPGMDGMQLLRLLRGTPATKDLKILMCTGAGMMSDVDEAFQAGASDYIVKPLDFAKLKMKVAKLASKG